MSAHIICKGSTQKGKPCTNRASVGPNSHFCRLHNPEGRGPPVHKKGAQKTKCAGTTARGRPCNYYTQTGTQFCGRHNGPAKESPPKPKAKPKAKPADPCLAKTARGIPCRKKAKNGTKYCGSHAYFQYTPPPGSGGYSYSSSGYSNFNWYNFFSSTYGFSGGYAPPPVQPDKIKEALNYFGLPESTNYNDIKKKYREFALKHHPDKGGEIALFQKIQEYYSVLGEKYK